MQLDFLCDELDGEFSDVLVKLQNASSIREASDYVLIHFEAPLDQSDETRELRASYGSFYFYRNQSRIHSGGTP